jgi:hypothetical protein
MRRMFVADVPGSSWDMLPGDEPHSKAVVGSICPTAHHCWSCQWCPCAMACKRAVDLKSVIQKKQLR